jgi:hypothetical protein
VSWQQVLENLVDHLAWPALVLGLAIVFRRHVRAFLARLGVVEAKAGSVFVRADASERNEEIERPTKGLPETSATSNPLDRGLAEHLEVLLDAEEDASDGILRTWGLVQASLAGYAAEVGLPPTSDPIELAAAIAPHVDDDEDFVGLVEVLKHGTDEVVHGRLKPHEEDVRAHVMGVRSILFALSNSDFNSDS